ncbi:hypothetical protein O181_035879 [Austropuccinia psidii MF-1]|uniref:DNA-directed RNA polymerase III subunit RPC8 n=1 Tax=Austropuccinia psidii MF-1 TaxID=1389203 RepID=A0A9Q3HAZ7_9BASI|nr:hypothetical protein [Austropuccinia psidii MF-1]
MFVLSHLKDTIKVQARDFGKDRAFVLSAEINRKYSNKVLPDVGLCIALFDLLSASEGKVLYGDGCLYHLVEFTLVVFRPFVGESLVGVVKSCTPAGIRVSLKFFDDIYIPTRALQYPSAYDPVLKEFFWASEYSDPEAAASMPADLCSYPNERRLYLQVGEPIRIRIEGEHFCDIGPKEAPKAIIPLPENAEANLQEQDRKEQEEGISPYSLIATCNGAGLAVDYCLKIKTDLEAIKMIIHHTYWITSYNDKFPPGITYLIPRNLHSSRTGECQHIGQLTVRIQDESWCNTWEAVPVSL